MHYTSLNSRSEVTRASLSSSFSKERTSRVLEQVRNANRHLKPGSIYSASNHSNLSSSASIKSDASFDLDDRSVASFRSVAGSQDFDGKYEV